MSDALQEFVGGIANSAELRYVILHHTGWPDHPNHYDFLLQLNPGRDDNDRALKAFATTADLFPAVGSRFTMNEDHRRAYLDYEGPVSGGRGSVVRVDHGTLRWLFTSRNFKFIASGTKLYGVFCMREIFHGGYALEYLAEE